jgi:UDP-N-acetylglucosamine 2-epimerase (non-hydrolysing)
MKIVTVIGTRPEIIRLSVIINKLDKLCDHVLCYTNQNYEYNLSTVFFDDLKVRTPNYYFNIRQQDPNLFLGEAMIEFNKVLDVEKPDKVLVLGDTTSGLLAIAAAKKGYPVYHMEAGNRAYSNKLPEEMNRRIIDAVSTYNLPYTDNSKAILLKEGYDSNFVFKTGNPIKEVLNNYGFKTPNKVKGIEDYILVTIHRNENTKNPDTLRNIVGALSLLAGNKVIFVAHPKTLDNLKKNDIQIDPKIEVRPAMGFYEFVDLERQAMLVITDSGTVPEETTLFRVPCVVLRDTTERRELMECGSFILAGTEWQSIIRSCEMALKMPTNWLIPEDYERTNVSDTVIKILLGQ